MKKKKKEGVVSVIVPVYNAEEFLDQCIESVINQSYQKIELILVNDGSTDNSEKICQKYARADKRIKVIPQKNKGSAAARNTGLRQARGEFVFFLDADDFIKKNTLKILISKYYQYQADLVMGNFSKLENNGQIVKQNVAFQPDDPPFKGKTKVLTKAEIGGYVRHFLKHPSNHLISYCWGRLYQLAIIKKNRIIANEKMRLFEDFVFNLEYLEHTKNLVFVNQPLYTYRMHNVHLSASMAIIKAESLLHDMEVFKLKATEFLRRAKGMKPMMIKKEIGHALTHYVIIFLVRTCRQVNQANRKKIKGEIEKIINAPIFRESLQGYRPKKGNSRILPWLTKLKLVDLIILYCQQRAYRRYGRPDKT